MSNLQIRMANAIRALSMDAVQQANSGHPGMPMGMADIAVGLWNEHLKHNPTDPHWIDRDRFVYQMVTDLCCYIRSCIFLVTTYQLKS